MVSPARNLAPPSTELPVEAAPLRLDHTDRILGRAAQGVEQIGAPVQAALEASWPVQASQALAHRVGLPDAVDRAVRRVDAKVQVVGACADRAAAGIKEKAVRTEAIGDDVEAALRSMASELRQIAERIEGRSASLTPDQRSQSKVVAQVLRALEGGLRSRIAEGGSLLAKGQVLTLRALSSGLELAGKVVRAGARTAALALTFVGRATSALFGTEVLRHTAVELTGGVRMGFLGRALNAGTFGAVFFPSLAMAEAEGSYAKAVFFDDGAGVATPVMSVGRNRRGKANVGLSLFFARATFDDKTESLFLGIPEIGRAHV